MTIVSQNLLTLQNTLLDLNLLESTRLESHALAQDASRALDGLRTLRDSGLVTGVELSGIEAHLAAGRVDAARARLLDHKNSVTLAHQDRKSREIEARVRQLTQWERITGVSSAGVPSLPIMRLERTETSLVPSWARDVLWYRLDSGEETPFVLGLGRNGYAILGSDEGCDICVKDPDVSPRHALIVFRDDEYWIRDLGSKHGTFVNGQSLERSEYRALGRGEGAEDIDLGMTSLRLYLPRPPEASGSLTVEEGLDADPYERLLRARIAALRDRYLPGLSDEGAASLFWPVAEEVGAAATVAGLLNVLRGAFLEDLSPVIQGIRHFFTSRSRQDLEAVPKEFGIYDKVVSLATEKFIPQGGMGALRAVSLSPEDFFARSWEAMEVPEAMASALQGLEGFRRQRVDLEKLEAALTRELGVEADAGDASARIDRAGEAQLILSPDEAHRDQMISYLSGELKRSLDAGGEGMSFSWTERFIRLPLTVDSETSVYDAIVRMSRERPEFFGEARMMFAMPLADPDGKLLKGIAFGQVPSDGYQGFAGLRYHALMRAIRIGRILSAGKKPLTGAQFTKIAAYCLEQVGVDLSHPAFDGRGRLRFPIMAFHGRFSGGQA